MSLARTSDLEYAAAGEPLPILQLAAGSTQPFVYWQRGELLGWLVETAQTPPPPGGQLLVTIRA